MLRQLLASGLRYAIAIHVIDHHWDQDRCARLMAWAVASQQIHRVGTGQGARRLLPCRFTYSGRRWRRYSAIPATRPLAATPTSSIRRAQHRARFVKHGASRRHRCAVLISRLAVASCTSSLRGHQLIISDLSDSRGSRGSQADRCSQVAARLYGRELGRAAAMVSTRSFQGGGGCDQSGNHAHHRAAATSAGARCGIMFKTMHLVQGAAMALSGRPAAAQAQRKAGN